MDKTYEYVISADDKEILINVKGTEACAIAKINVYSKPYFIEKDGTIDFMREDEYYKYDWEEM